MEMDRQTMIVVFGAIIALTLIGTTYLAAPARDVARPVYAEEDVRHKLQQDEAKKKRKGKKSASARTESSSSSGGDTSDSDAEEPPAEEPEAEEPSIE
jgi:hypothetical protein